MDLTAQLEAADRHLALSAPHLHPRPGPIRTIQRQADQRRAARDKAAGGQKLGLLQQVRQLKAAKALQARPAQPPPPPTSPEQRKRDEAVQRELQTDLTKTLTRTMRTVAGRFCDDDKAARIEESPAVQELLSRTTGWVDRLPDVAKLAVVTGAKLL